ncbi:MAG TPA: YjbF family lipoprotein [Rhizomicrobium sp.]|nr:YjbF family lipoprotein [Rhizomicrobium sp.]
MTRKGARLPRWLALLPALMLGGCNSYGDSTYSQYWKMLGEMWRAQANGGAITRNQAAAITYASMGWRLNGAREQIIVLATDTNGDLLWTASNRIVLVTRDGRLRRTVGLPHDLAGTTGSPPPPSEALMAPFSSKRQMDFPDMQLYGLAVECRAAARARQTIKILGTAIATTRVDEDCHATGRDWNFTDMFWLGSDGMVMRALQHVHPAGDTLLTEIFRPPG